MPRQSRAAFLLVVLAVGGCVSAQASALNTDIADYNRRLLAFQQDYRLLMSDLVYLRQAPGFVSLMTKATTEAGRRKAVGQPFRSLEEAEAALGPSLTADERAAVPGAKGWITHAADVLRTGQALAAERVELERRRGEVAISVVREQEVYQGLTMAISVLGTLAILSAVTAPTTCIGSSTTVGATTSGFATCR